MVTPAAPSNRDDDEGKQASRVETPTATPTVTPRESVDSVPESSVPAAQGTAAVAAAGAVTEGGLGATQLVGGEESAPAEEGGEDAENAENVEGDCRAAVDGGAHRAAAAEALVTRLQEQLQEMEVRTAGRASRLSLLTQRIAVGAGLVLSCLVEALVA